MLSYKYTGGNKIESENEALYYKNVKKLFILLYLS